MLQIEASNPILVRVEQRNQHFFTVVNAGTHIVQTESFNTREAAWMAKEILQKKYGRR
ncbi:Uncharacterised protein [BD1-7 clade bacterium]|uniref:DUF1508 domain-containing protein n=1 Tax=BD1-7 clade bacterium TaxID=2029982 RepID=A0A5S9P1M2_9GAMM|nr:Uncharacterised protein [BD1-7 clade bacterium]CAA0097047.1 Uncharacterised protein [BD1-7 clade bacterium]CAA0109644.1 Uncharacterised protein [BD1-7 clade bacterium]CAA0116323.1 Uncharacterised protein [BD1-7 clade bacterium]CAA0119991.1 Uncharacterised protein [BD1-7 clade bacterium]